MNESALVTLRGNTHPLAQPQFDRGAAPPDLPMARMLLVLKRSAAQEAALQTLLDDQQDRNSPSYHQWLTPDAFGQQFGPSDQDIQTITGWLESHGFQVAPVGRGRTAIEFSGTALQVLQAFHTEIHKYVVNGQEHWANASDPQIPAALAPVVAGVVALHNFPKQPMHHVAGIFSKSKATGQVKVLSSEFTLPNSNYCGISGYCYLVGPYDFAKIYNVQGLWNESPAIDGTGQTIAIVGVSNINIQDVRDFRNLFGLPINDPQVILNGPDPGLVSGDETEADLDVEWSGAVAPGATIKFVVSASTNSDDGVDLSALYIVENNLGPVMSESFGECELFLGTSGNSFENAIRQQAAAEGITFINSSGDEGAARCDTYSGRTPDPATHGLTVSGLASSPHGVAVGGTDFANYGSPIHVGSASVYWSLNNDLHQASVLGYVPETTWNDSCTNGAYVTLGAGSTAEAACNNAQLAGGVVSVGGGGGKSNCITSDGSNVSSCTGGYAKPSWQSAPGVPADGARDIPDVSLFASSGFMDSAYIVCEADQVSGSSSCSLSGLGSTFLGVGGTSASAPAFAGMMALLNQFTQSKGQGNANYVLYKLASLQSQRNANCNASGTPASVCIFNDVTSGSIAMPCANGSPNCTVTNTADRFGVLSGYDAGAGYDLATGLGSVNAYNLVHGWSMATFTPTTTSLALNSGNPVSITHGQSLPINVTVTPNTATGDVSLIGSPGGAGSIEMGTLTLQNGAGAGTTATLAGGGGKSYTVKAHYAGDGTYAPSDSIPVSVTVAPEPSKTIISIPVFDPTTGRETGNTPSSVAYGAPIGVRVDVGNAQAAVTFPPQPVCALLTCPTGSVTVTDSLNGGAAAPLGGSGVFSLNQHGYSEVDGILLAGGAHNLSSAYPGDNSYSQDTSSYFLTVTPGPTQISAPAVNSPQLVGTPAQLSCTVSSNLYNGVIPTGTITFYDGTTPIPGPVTMRGATGVQGGYYSNVFAFGPASFTTPGTHTLTAQYSGDANYLPVTSSANSLTVLYPTTMAATSSALHINLGQSVTITATVSTISNSLPMTGVFQFSGNTTPPATVTPKLSTDASGNQILVGSSTFTPQSDQFFSVTYSGDSNFENAYSPVVFVSVALPDFSITTAAPGVTINAGQTGTTTLTVTPLNNIPGTVALTCYTSQTVEVTCAFSPASPLSLSNGNAVTATAMIVTQPPSASTTSHIVAIRPPSIRRTPPPAAGLLSLAGAFVLMWLLVFSGRKWRRLATRISMAGMLLVVLSCGSGSTDIGGGGGGGGPVPTTLTLATANVKVPSGTNATFTATVNSTKPITGAVNFYDAGQGIATGYTVNGVVTVQVGNLLVGTHVITAQYLGDGNNLSSQTNGFINQVITGNAQIAIWGTTSGGLAHFTPINVTIQ